MVHITERTNGVLTNHIELRFGDIDRVVKLYKTIGYEEDPFFTTPEWGRYCLLRADGKNNKEIYIEEETDYETT